MFRWMGRLGPRCAAAGTLVLLTSMVGIPGASAAPGSGSISGRVTDDQGAPLSGICVTVPSLASVTTDVDGLYSLGGFATGQVRIQYSDCRPTPGFLPQWYLGRSDEAAADAVNVNDGADTPLPDVRLQPAASLSGVVTDPGGVGVGGWCVEANVGAGQGWSFLGGSTTAPDGTWTIDRLPAATVRVRFRDCTGTSPYMEQWWSGATSFDAASPVTVAAGEHRGGLDAHLVAGVAVSGRVTDQNGNPLAGIGVNVGPTNQGQGTGVQTDADGRYRTSPVPPGSYRVQFAQWANPPAWATEYWNDKPTWNSADVLNLSLADGPEHTGVDASLAPAATIRGRVTDQNGNPLSGICVEARLGDQGDQGLNGTSTSGDGTYVLGGLPAGDLKIAFRDCGTTGPWAGQWWQGADSLGTARTIPLLAGDVRTGIDARLARGAAIAGRVTDAEGHPLNGICAQASTSNRLGGFTRTDADGRYMIPMDHSGDYRVQFVDCNDDQTSWAGQWWNGQPVNGTPGTVPVGTGQTVTGIDAVLSSGVPGRVTGRVTDLNGTAMTNACALVYLPSEFVRAAPVAPDGTYAIENVPSGSYALAFVGCQGNGDPQATVRSPQNPAWSYRAAWWKDRILDIRGSGDGGPDPFAQGAELVTVTSGAHVGDLDDCFGCTALRISSLTASRGALQLIIESPILVASTGSTSAAAPDPLTYTASCTSADGGAAGSGSGTTATLTVGGLSPGASYSCTVTASTGRALLGRSAPSDPIVVPSQATTPTTTTTTTPTATTTTTTIPGTGAGTGSGSAGAGTTTMTGQRLAFTG